MERILIVEDDLLIAADVEGSLSSAGFVTHAAHDGITAIQLATQHQVDVIIMDIDLGAGLDGISTAQQINSHSAIPVIFITRFKEAHYFESAKRAFPVNYISKPFDEQTLLRAVDLAIANKTREDQQQPAADSIFVLTSSDGQYHKVYYQDMRYIKASRMYTRIYLDKDVAGSKKDATGIFIEMSMPSKEVMEQFKNPDIVRVHRSYYVNLNKIDRVQGANLTLGDKEITVTDDYKQNVFARLTFLRHLRRK